MSSYTYRHSRRLAPNHWEKDSGFRLMSLRTAARRWQPNSNSKAPRQHPNLAEDLAGVKTGVVASADAKTAADLAAGKNVAAIATVHPVSTTAADDHSAVRAAGPAQEQARGQDRGRTQAYSMPSTWWSCA